MTTETLMTEAATTTEGTAASQPATASATGAGEGSQQQQSTEGQGTQSQQAEGSKTEGEQEKKPEGAPETYEFKAPEGVTFDDSIIGAFSEISKEMDLPQDKAQKILDKMAPAIAARNAEQFEATKTQWTETSKADKEFGGDKLQENLALAKKARDAFATPELRALLNDTGLGNHPEIIRFFYRTGKAISEDGFVSPGRAAVADTPAKRMFPNQA